MRIFFPTVVGLLAGAAIIAVVIATNYPHQQLVTSKVQAERVRGLAAELQRKADRMDRETGEPERQNVVTTNQDMSFPASGGQMIIPARTTLQVMRFWGDNVVVQYNGTEVSLPRSSVDFR